MQCLFQASQKAQLGPTRHRRAAADTRAWDVTHDARWERTIVTGQLSSDGLEVPLVLFDRGAWQIMI